MSAGTEPSARPRRGDELELQIDLLSVRDTDQFLPLSLELYGGAPPPLLAEAEALLDDHPPPPAQPAPVPTTWFDASEFARLVEVELDHYRAFDPDIGAHVEVRTDTPGVLVSNGDVLIGASTRVAASRVEALLQHEVGTHVLTYVNGCRQPLRLLAAGLAGYEETQEAFAVLAEYLVGGLRPGRVRELAARVVAVHRMINGDPFATVHKALTAAGLSDERAFTTTMRVFRGGGFTKDAIYLRGLGEVLTHVRANGGLDVLLLGKLPLREAPLVEALLERGILVQPHLRPRYLADGMAAERLVHLDHVTCLADLLRS